MNDKKWTDTTSYARGEEKKQTAWTLSNNLIRITVMNEHRYYPGEWVMHCRQVGINEYILGEVEKYSLQQIKARSIKIVQSRLREMLDFIS
jgi:hypothetical protein